MSLKCGMSSAIVTYLQFLKSNSLYCFGNLLGVPKKQLIVGWGYKVVSLSGTWNFVSLWISVEHCYSIMYSIIYIYIHIILNKFKLIFPCFSQISLVLFIHCFLPLYYILFSLPSEASPPLFFHLCRTIPLSRDSSFALPPWPLSAFLASLITPGYILKLKRFRTRIHRQDKTCIWRTPQGNPRIN